MVFAMIGLLAVSASAIGEVMETPAAAIERARLLASSDKPAALQLLRDTVTRLNAPADLPLRWQALSRACFLTGDGDAAGALSLADTALQGMDIGTAGRWYGELQQCRGYALEQLDRYDEAERAYQIGIQEGARLGDAELSAEALVHRGELRYFRGEYGDALADLKQSYDLSVQRGAHDDARYVLNAIANLYGSAGEYDRATVYYRQVLAADEAAGNQRGVATAHVNLGITLDKQGHPDDALPEYEKALAIQRARGDAAEVADIQRSLAIVLTKLERAQEALVLLDSSLAQFRSSHDEEMIAETRLSRAVTLRALGRAREAIGEFDAVAPWFEQAKNRPFLQKLQSERALAFAATQSWEQAYAARNAQIAVQAEIDAQLRQERTARLRVAFDTQKTEQENRDLQRENALRAEALRDAGKIRRLQASVIALAVSLLLIAVVFAWRQVGYARRLRALALTDELTRLPNRRHIFELASERLQASRRQGEALCVMSLDVDHFKRINDTFGHDAGDRVLQRVARACESAVQHGGRVGRVGGEEFLIVLPTANIDAAIDMAERVRRGVAGIDAHDLAPDLNVTASIGLAWANPEEPDWSPAARRADAALYAAKAGGRNRVMLAAA
jgi:diguanylate cyclase (GGDEF)-like protein